MSDFYVIFHHFCQNVINGEGEIRRWGGGGVEGSQTGK